MLKPPLQYSLAYCHMCAAFAIIYRHLFASQPLVIMINTDKRKVYRRKNIITGPFELFLRSEAKTEASHPKKKQKQKQMRNNWNVENSLQLGYKWSVQFIFKVQIWHNSTYVFLSRPNHSIDVKFSIPDQKWIVYLALKDISK